MKVSTESGPQSGWIARISVSARAYRRALRAIAAVIDAVVFTLTTRILMSPDDLRRPRTARIVWDTPKARVCAGSCPRQRWDVIDQLRGVWVFGTLHHLLGRPFFDYIAAAQHDDPLGDAAHESEVVRDEDHRQPPFTLEL